LIESRKELKEDPQERLLKDILSTLRNVSDSSAFKPDATNIRINVLWFSSLILTLGSALGGVLTKGWIAKCSHIPLRKTSGDACLHFLRVIRMQQWGIGGIITIISLLIQIALFLFFAGLGYLLFDAPNEVKYVVFILILTIGFFYLITTFLPLVFPACPLQTPFTEWILPGTASGNKVEDNHDRDAGFLKMWNSLINSLGQLTYLRRDPTLSDLQVQILLWTITNTSRHVTLEEALKALAGVQDSTALHSAFSQPGAASAFGQKLEQYLSFSSIPNNVTKEDKAQVALRALLNVVQAGVTDDDLWLSEQGRLKSLWKQRTGTEHQALSFCIQVHQSVNRCQDDGHDLENHFTIPVQSLENEHSSIGQLVNLAVLRGLMAERGYIQIICDKVLAVLLKNGE
jgi:hypothetical protein